MSTNRISNIVEIWSPSGSVETAEAFAREIANAERGVAVVESGRHRIPRLNLVTPGRERKARVMDGLAVTLLMAFMAALGVSAYFAAVPR